MEIAVSWDPAVQYTCSSHLPFICHCEAWHFGNSIRCQSQPISHPCAAVWLCRCSNANQRKWPLTNLRPGSRPGSRGGSPVPLQRRTATERNIVCWTSSSRARANFKVAQWFLFRDCGLAGAPRWFHSKTGSRVDVVLKRKSIAYLCVFFPF